MSELEARSDADDSALRTGDVIAERFVIDRALGSGATGTVFRARRLDDDQVIALKVVHRHLCGDRQIFGRYRREAKILSHLEGDHIARLLDVVEHDGLLAIALEHVEGESLEAALARRGPLPPAEAVEIALQVCRALGPAHARGVVHRDLKPGNVLLERRSNAGPGQTDWKRVRVVDFGLAKIVQEDMTTTGLTEQDMIFGTAEYMAPEQARGEDADLRADIYAVGVMLYEMVVGRVPHSGRTPIATMTAHLTEDPERPCLAAPTLPISPDLDAVIMTALAKSPEDRFPNARALAEALATASAREGVSTPPIAPPSAPSQLAVDDTDLHLEDQIAHSATIPFEEVVPRTPSSASPSADAIRVEAEEAPLASRSRFALVFAIAALLAIGAGALLALW